MPRALRTRLVLLVLAASVVPLLLLGLQWSRELDSRARVELAEEQAKLAEIGAHDVGAMVEDVRRLLEATARLAIVRTGERPEVETLFARIESGRLAGAKLLAASRDGMLVAARGAQPEPLPPSVASSGFRQALRQAGFGVGDPEPEGPPGRGLVDFWSPVTDETGATVRLVGLAVDGRAFAAAWERLRLGPGAAVLLVGRNGRVLAETPPAEGGFGRDVSSAPLWIAMRGRASGTGEGALTADGAPRIFGFRRVPAASWVLAVGAPPAAASRALPVPSWPALGALALLAAGFCALAAWMTEAPTRGLQALAAAARRLATGDLRTAVAAAGAEEVEAIAASLERVRQQSQEQAAVMEALQTAAARERAGGGDEPRPGEPARRATEVEIFQAVAAAAARPAEGGPACEAFLSKVLSHLGWDAAALFLVDDRELRLLAQVGHSPAAREAMARLPLGEGIAGRAARGGDPLVLENAAVEARLVRDVVRLEGLHGLAAVPLEGRGRILGVLEVAGRARRKLSGPEHQMLHTVCQHLGLALANAALQEEAGRRAGRLHTLARLTQSMTASLSPQEVLYLAVLAAVELIDPAYVRVWLWDPAGGRGRPGPWHGQTDLAEEGAPDEVAARAPEAQVVALAARSAEPLFIPQIASDPRAPEPRWWARRGALSLAALALGIGERVLGVLTVVARGASEFPEEDRELLGLLAGQAAVALENARLYQERAGEAAAPRSPLAYAETEAPQIEAAPAPPAPAAGPDLRWIAEALAGLDAAVASSEDAESALEVIADEARHVVGAEVAAVFRVAGPPGDGAGRLRLIAGGLLVGPGALVDGQVGVVAAALAARAPRAAVAPFAEMGEETLEFLALSSGYEAVAATPVFRGAAAVGVLAVTRRSPEVFGEAALAALEAVAGRVAAVWERESRLADVPLKT